MADEQHRSVTPERAGERHRRRLLAAFAVIVGFFVVQAGAALWTDSLALLADSGHMLTDVVGLAMALAAMQLATSQSRRGTTNPAHTFGMYRLEILAALANATLLAAVALWVIVESVRRLGTEPDVLGGPMLIVGLLGLAVNVVAFLLLRPGAKESLNVRGAYFEVLADTVGSVGVVIAAVAMQLYGWTWADAVVGAAVGVWILPRAWRLGRSALRVLLQVAPEHVAVDRLVADLAALDGVVGVHDLHVWTLTSEMDAASVHLVVAEDADVHAVLDRARTCLVERYRIDHGTFQVEPEAHVGCHLVGW